MQDTALQAKTDVELKTKHIAQNNPLFIKAREGTLTREEMGHYLANLRFLFGSAPKYFQRAAQKARDLGNTALADFYLEKLEEERGHEYWADDDLKHYRQDSFKMADVTNETKNVIAFLNQIIDEDPRLLIAYMLFAEYFTVLAAPEFFKNIEEKCNIRRHEVSAIAKHEEADQDHALENFDAVRKFIGGDEISARLYQCIDHSAEVVGRCMSSCIQ